MSTSVQFPNQSLYGIESNIASLMACRDEAAEEGDAEAVAAADALIAEWTSQEVLGRKVNAIVYAIREYRKRSEIATEEADRIKSHAAEWAAKAERLERDTLAAMLVHNVTRIESETNTLKVQGNGGLKPLEITARPSELPEQYRQYSVTMSGSAYRFIRSLCKGAPQAEAVLDTAVCSLSHDVIRKALAEKMPCPECGGAFIEEREVCPRCDGSGLVPRTIHGARLLDRGHHLRYE